MANKMATGARKSLFLKNMIWLQKPCTQSQGILTLR
jgi:hypothetical protein